MSVSAETLMVLSAVAVVVPALVIAVVALTKAPEDIAEEDEL